MSKNNKNIDPKTIELIEGSSIEQLKELAYSHVQEIAQKDVTINELTQVVTDLHTELDTKTTEVEIKAKVVKIGTKKYKVNAPVFRLGSSVHQAEELESNEDLAAELLKIEGQGVLTLIK